MRERRLVGFNDLSIAELIRERSVALWQSLTSCPE
jgi:hypothetical protein